MQGLRRVVLMVCSLAALVSLLALRGAWDKPGNRYVIINTDDAGMYPSVNRATIEALEQGAASSASIMVPCPGFDEFAEYAAAHPEKDFGIHLTLTCETKTARWGPVLPAEEVPSLVDEEGYFWRASRLVAEHADRGESERELRAQIERALAAGIGISHLDNHMFSLSTRGDLAELYVGLAVEYGLPVRLARKLSPGDAATRDPSLAEVHRRLIGVLRAHHLPVVDVSESDNYLVDPAGKREFFLNLLRRLEPGVTELVVHCAHDESGGPVAPGVRGREEDLRFFTSAECAEELERLGVEVIGWRELAGLRIAD